MSTYTDLHNTAKETLNVDYHTRVTPQKVHFVNPENTYSGVFSGEISTTGNNYISGGIVKNIVLSNSVLDNVVFKNGLVIDDLQQSIAEISSDLTAEAEKRSVNDVIIFNYLSDQLSTTNLALAVERIERKQSDVEMSVDLLKTINFKADQSFLRDLALGSRIDSEITDRISSDEQLKKDVNNKMLHDRHFKMHLIDNREFPLSIHDYAINTYVDSNANAYVYIDGDIEQRPIGRIEKAKYDGSVLTSFEFNAFAEHPSTYELTGAGVFLYYFDKDNVSKYTGIGNYRLQCDVTKTTSLNNMQLQLNSSNNNGYYNAYLSVDDVKAAIIDANCKKDQSGHLSSCTLRVTSKLLSNFILTSPIEFTANGQTKVFVGRNGNQCEATLSDNTFYLYDKRTSRYYVPVMNADTSITDIFGRVYDGNVKVAFDGELQEVGVDVEDKHFNLKSENNFKTTFDEAKPYVNISYDKESNKIQVKEEKVYYKYSCNGALASVIPGYADIPNKRITDEYGTINAILNVDSPSLGLYVNKTYTLYRVESSNRYYVEQDITTDNYGKIKLEFIKGDNKLNVEIIPNTSASTIWNFSVDTSTAPIEIDESIVRFTSKQLCNDIKDIKPYEKLLDERYNSKFIIYPDLVNKEYSGETKVIISQAKTEKKDTLAILMPDKKRQIPNDYKTASSKFILNFKVYTESLQDDDFVQIIIKSDVEDKFYYMNREVSKIFIKKNKWTTLQFEELRPHRYVITDLDYSEIDWRLKWLHNELSCHEISSYETMMKLSDDVEFLLSTDREGMSYKGTLPYMAGSEWTGNLRLSAFISQSPYIHNGLKLGDTFKLSAAQYGKDVLFDKNNISNYLGENDYFVVNVPYIQLSDVLWSNIDIFRNSESEVAYLSIELVKLINATSSYISGEVNRISTELSTELDACELSVNGLSVEVDRISSEISTTMKLSVEELQDLIVSNDVDIAELSDKVEFILSVDKETVNYKGILPEYVPTEPDHAHNWQLCEYIAGIITPGIGKFDLKLGDLFKVGIPPRSALYDHRAKEGEAKTYPNVIFGIDDFFIVNKDIVSLTSIEVSDIDIFRNATAEVSAAYIMLSSEISALELSVSDISSQINRISSEISSELNKCELSVNGLSVEVDRISSEISSELNKCELSVNGLSSYTNALALSVSDISSQINRISSEISSELNKCELSVNGLSVEVDRISSEISSELNKCELSVNGLSSYTNALALSVNSISTVTTAISSEVQNIWKDIKGGVNYKGHLKGFEDYRNLPLCMIFGYHYNLVDTEGTHTLSASIPLNNGWLYNVSLTAGSYDVADPRPFTLENNDYLIIHSKDSKLSCVEISDLTRDNIDIIEAVQDDYIRLKTLQDVSAWLENDYSQRDLRLSIALSNEIDKLALSTDGLSNYVDSLELSVNGLSVEVDRISSEISSTISRISSELSTELNRCELSVNGLSIRTTEICTEISTTLSLSVDLLQKQIISNDSDISTISSDLSVLEYHYNRTFDEEFYQKASVGPDLSADVLKIVNSENTNELYTLLFLSGTLVLVKKQK